MNVQNDILSLIGRTPIVKLPRISAGLKTILLAKLEFLNPGGSVKDRIGLAMLRDAEEKGLLKKGGTVVEPSSGNTGIGLALACILLGYNLIVTMPDKMSDEKRMLLEAYGAQVIVCQTDRPSGHPENYISVAQKLARENPNAFMPNQYQNEANVRVHYETTAREIWDQTDGRITHFVAGVGTGGTITGVSKFLKEKNPSVKVIAVDPGGSIIYDKFVRSDSTHLHQYKIEGIGEDFIPGTLDFSNIDETIRVSDKEAYTMARKLAREEAILAGSSSGAAVAGAIKIARNLGEWDTVVTILPDRGERYLSKLYNDNWMKENDLL
ncbi:MAG: PLP-dependent cysteine synthase family protein [Rhabdochlamydiaceae bacterium]